jgi:hypothetical protein
MALFTDEKANGRCSGMHELNLCGDELQARLKLLQTADHCHRPMCGAAREEYKERRSVRTLHK